MSATIKGSQASQQGSNPANKFQVILPTAALSQKITTSGTSQQSSAVAANCSVVRLYCTQDVYIAIGANPTAVTTTSLFLPANTVEYFGCAGADKIAAIQASSGGTLYISEGAT